MRSYIYKTIIFCIAIVLVFEFTIGRKFNQVTEKFYEIVKTENLIKGFEEEKDTKEKQLEKSIACLGMSLKYH